MLIAGCDYNSAVFWEFLPNFKSLATLEVGKSFVTSRWFLSFLVLPILKLVSTSCGRNPRRNMPGLIAGNIDPSVEGILRRRTRGSPFRSRIQSQARSNTETSADEAFSSLLVPSGEFFHRTMMRCFASFYDVDPLQGYM